MTTVIWAAAILLCFTVGSHLISVAIGVVRCRVRTAIEPAPANAPAISLVRPGCGLATPADPIVPTVQRLIAEHPQVRAKLLIGDERISANPKLNNCFKGWNAAAHPWIILADSNVLMPRDYISRLMATWRDDTGLVCSP